MPLAHDPKKGFVVTYTYSVFVHAQNASEAGDLSDVLVEEESAENIKHGLEYTDTMEVGIRSGEL